MRLKKTKRVWTFVLAMAAIMPTTAQTTLTPTREWQEIGGRYASAVVADLNNDGYCDMVYGGTGNGVTYYAGSQDYERYRTTHVLTYRPVSKQWNIPGYLGPEYFDEQLVINVGDRPSLSACDINRDGIMDIVAFEQSGVNASDKPMLDHVSQKGVFIGRGDGNFDQAELTFVDANGEKADFDLRNILSADVADFNGDGLIDIVGIGYQKKGASPRKYATANVVLFNRGGGVFEVSRFFSDPYVKDYGQAGVDYHFQQGQVQVYDFNNDGLPDFFVNAQSDDRSVLGVRIDTSTHFSDLFLNDPAHPGQFRQQRLFDPMVFTPMSEGGIAVADFTGDGVADIFYSGWTGVNRGSYVWGVKQLTINGDGTLTFTELGHEGIEEMRNQNSTNTQYMAYDWDGDGNFDIINAGLSTRLNTQTCFISTGNGEGGFTNAYRLAGYSEGCTAILDWNGDGVGDYVMIGQTDDDTFFKTDGETRTFVATVNPNGSAARPDAPTLQQPKVEGDVVTLGWTAAASSKPNVTYEYFVRDAQGTIVCGGNAFVGGEKDGKRKVSQPGNAFNAKSIRLTLPNGTYTYGVQTVNARLDGSAFATGTFTVTNSAQETADATIPVKVYSIENEEGCSYAGPVIDRDAPDPTVIRGDDGYYYLFSTEVIHNVPIYRSKNLIDWRYIGTAFNDNTRPSFVKDAAIWAPDVQRFGDTYYLYVSMSRWGGTWDCGIGVANATKPYGPYRNTKKLFISSEIGVENSIDPFAIEDEGKKYLFWGSFHGIYGIELTDDGMDVAEDAKPRRIAGGLTEGTYIIKRNGYYYLIGSAGACCEGENSTYRLVVARSEKLFGPYVDKLGGYATNDAFSNLLFRNADVIGPGHNANFVKDDAGQYWMLYHGYDASDVDAGRKVYLSRIEWDEEGWPYVRNVQPTTSDGCPLIGEKYAGISSPAAPDASGDEKVSVYPHMVKRDITITHAGGEPFSYQLVNLNGTPIATGKATGQATVDLYAVPTGMYIVTVRSASGIHTDKVIRY